MTPTADTGLRQAAFNAAMARYETRAYRSLVRLISFANVGLQVALVGLVWSSDLGWRGQLLAFVLATLAADLVNGCVHMFLDGNDSYETAVGPLIANFHLHHRSPAHRVRPLPVVYFEETGSKVWLVFVQTASVILIATHTLPAFVGWFLAWFGVLSSVAEVSHYLCHVPESRAGSLLQKTGLFLPRRHHMRHHLEDNVNYAFLNGLTDPVLNLVARKLVGGYKSGTDQHYLRYGEPG